jgi:transcriptional regulator with XRE-family HTH domain
MSSKNLAVLDVSSKSARNYMRIGTEIDIDGEIPMPKTGDAPSADDTLGAHLARLRNAAGLSLRQVEEATDKEISNAYLSQLETNKITKPSPHILDTLARIYKTQYNDLMERAGYVSSEATGNKRAKAATFAVQGLTDEEEKALIAYLGFIRGQKRKQSK